MKKSYIKGAIFFIAIIVAIVCASIAEGAEKIQEGDPAPYDGVVISEYDFNNLVRDLKYAEAQISNYVNLTTTLDSRISSLSNQVYLLENINTNYVEYIDALNRIHELNKRKWYNEPPLWFSVGVLSGGALMYGGAWIAGTVR